MSLWGFKRYWRYYWAIAKVKLMSMLEYRFDIISASLGTYAYTGMMILFIWVLFGQIENIGGWSQSEIFLLFGISQIIFYFHYAFFWATYKMIPESIQMGDLDFYLLKPISPLFQISVSRFNLVDALPSLGIPILIVGYAWDGLDLQLAWWLIVIAVLGVVIGGVISSLVHVCLALTAFWITDTRALQKVYGELEDLRKYPLSLYPDSLKWVVLTIVPIGLVAYVPTFWLVRGWSWELLGFLLFSLGFFVWLTKWVWESGMRAYSSASS